MLSRKPTAIKLTQEDIQEFDAFVAAQKEPSPETDEPTHSRKSSKGKDVAPAAQDRQQDMDERIGVSAGARGVRR
jgi:hypothetical protein